MFYLHGWATLLVLYPASKFEASAKRDRARVMVSERKGCWIFAVVQGVNIWEHSDRKNHFTSEILYFQAEAFSVRAQFWVGTRSAM